MEAMNQDILLFFDKQPMALPLYEAFAERVLELFPETKIQAQKSQISFFNRHMYACISFQRVKKTTEMPHPYIVVTLGLSYPLSSDRVAAKAEPYPGRWTTHIVIGRMEEIDDELICWLQQAYDFAACK